MAGVKYLRIGPRSRIGDVVAHVRHALRDGDNVELAGWGFPAYRQARRIVRALQERGISARLVRTGRKRVEDPFTFYIPEPIGADESGPTSGELVAGHGGSVAFPISRTRYAGGAALASDAPDKL